MCERSPCCRNGRSLTYLISRSASVRNALVHVEKSAFGWLGKVGPGPVLGWGFGLGTFGAGSSLTVDRCFRYLNTKNWDLKVGATSCNLREVVNALVTMALNLPIDARINVGVPSAL